MKYLLLLLIAAAALAQDSVFKVDVRLVRLLASVKDSTGASVGSLKKDDFKVFENEIPQEIAVFERYTEQPLSVSLLIDTSLSTMKDLPLEIASVRKFLASLFGEGNPEDAVALFSFNYAVRLERNFTRRIEALEARLKFLKPEGGTSLYDAVVLATQSLEDREGRHVMIAVTDGGDTTSAHTFHQAVESLHRADTVIYPIVIVPVSNDAGRNTGGENALFTMAQSTGGRVYYPSIGAPLDAAFADILRELRTQYLIGYYPKGVPSSKDRFHRVRVDVARKGLRVVTRAGYYREDSAK